MSEGNARHVSVVSGLVVVLKEHSTLVVVKAVLQIEPELYVVFAFLICAAFLEYLSQ
jgi:hypothetical protein